MGLLQIDRAVAEILAFQGSFPVPLDLQKTHSEPFALSEPYLAVWLPQRFSQSDMPGLCAARAKRQT
jgi:hypothetical protein